MSHPDSSPQKQRKADVYSAGERGWMLAYQRAKQIVLGPTLGLMTRIGIKPNHVTIVSLVCGLLCCPFYLWSLENPYLAHVAFALLFAHFVIDGIDGPLARHLKMDSQAGSFVDTAADQVVIFATTATLMVAWVKQMPGGIDIWAGSSYIFFYTITVVFSMLRNTIDVPYRYLVRPRNFVYLWWLLEYYLFPATGLEGSIIWLVWISNAILAISAWRGFNAVRRYLLRHA